MSRKILASIALLALSFVTPGQAAPTAALVDIPDTGLGSPNVHWVTTLHTGSAVGGKFAEIGGKMYYFQTTVRPPFYIPSGLGTGGVVVLDVTNPEQPVPAGFFPIPVSQNEDVELSANRGILLYSMDNRAAVSVPLGLANACTGVSEDPQDRATLCRRVGGALFVIDISMPNAPRLRSVLQYPAIEGFREDGRPLSGTGHTASCILDCNYAYVAGGRNRGVYVVDLRDLDAPTIMGKIASPAGADNDVYKPGVVHDVHSDRFGNVWMAGSGGTAMYAPITNPMKPKLLATVTPGDNKATNQLIHHGVQRFDRSTVIIGEENFANGCGRSDAGVGAKDEDGRLQVWKIDSKAKRLRVQDTWDSEIAAGSMPETLQDTIGIGCSSHWFDFNSNKIVADGWYEQGLRFLDISNQRKIRQIGYWIGPGTAASQAQFVPGRPDLVYVADYSRGLDVIRLDDGGRNARTVTAPLAREWFRTPGVDFAPRLRKDETFGWACART
ncbi:MAG: LVIVD repeat-containing protein [Actinomycetota bacterium]